MSFNWALKKVAKAIISLFCMVQINGCATGSVGLECGVESISPTIMATIDSFESAAMSIRLSNRVLLETPISEQSKWPSELFGAPAGIAIFKMGFSLLGASRGTTIPTELDQETGFPKPTSSLYIFLSDREKMLRRETVRDDVRFFAYQPPQVIARQIPANRRNTSVPLIDDNVYRNPLMAYGVVTANSEEMVRLQQEIELISNGFKTCDAWVHKSKEGDVKPAACKDPALTQVSIAVRLTGTGSSERAAYYDRADNERTQPPQSKRPSWAGRGNRAAVAEPDTTVESEHENRQPSASRADWNRNENSKQKKNKNKLRKNIDDQSTVQIAPQAEPATTDTELMPPAPGQYDNEKVIIVNERERMTNEKTAELETMRTNYGKLADRVYNASVAGADFTMAALTKITCAIINGNRAVPNAQNEIRGWRGTYNAVTLVPRFKGIIKAFGYYKNNLELQFVAYRTMYQQLKGTYPSLQDEETQKTKEAKLRIEVASSALKQLDPKLEMLLAGKDVYFEEKEIMQINYLAGMFPAQPNLEDDLRVAWGIE